VSLDRVSRRRLLGVAGAGALAGAAGIGGFQIADARQSGENGDDGYPFHGEHQSGIVTPAQDRLHFASFDVTTESRDDLISLLRAWTDAAAAMTSGRAVGSASATGYDSPPADTGEALGLPAAGLTLTFGFGATLFEKEGKDRFGLRGRRPKALRRLPHFSGDNLDPARTDGDLCVQACADDPQVAVHAIRNLARIGFGTVSVRWSQLGFSRTSTTSTAQSTPRNLFGFKDGTANVKAEETADLEKHVWVPADELTPSSAWLAGGSFLVARRIRMRIETWDRTSLREQEGLIGRTKGVGAPLSGGTEFTEPEFAQVGGDGKPLIAVDSHVRLAHPSENQGVRMLRRGYNFTDGNDSLGRLDAGLFFLAFVKDPRTHYIPMQSALSSHDSLMEYLTHTASGLYAVPPGVPDGSLVLGADGTPVTTDDSPYVGEGLFA